MLSQAPKHILPQKTKVSVTDYTFSIWKEPPSLWDLIKQFSICIFPPHPAFRVFFEEAVTQTATTWGLEMSATDWHSQSQTQH